MALEEHDREDLFRDGRMMPVRGECVIDAEKVLVGFRRQGQLSLYCGPDPVFQFNSERHLRRVYFQGTRLVAKGGGLVEFTRVTRGGKVEFLSTPLDPAMQTIILSTLNDWLRKLDVAVQSTSIPWRVIGDDDLNFRSRVLRWLQQLGDHPKIASSPNA